MKTTIYGQEIELQEIDAPEHVVDVMIIARAVQMLPDGGMEDALYISTTPQTTWLIQSGMIHESIDVIRSDGE
ncbi:hypothetical protein [Glutamicibacter sp. AOP3-A1-12]|uniref:hypothetical protein n=1 Tax=Glutamicibacter sp. AOP3-A1-12 TaxID=3457701 RepID=UPI0040348C00